MTLVNIHLELEIIFSIAKVIFIVFVLEPHADIGRHNWHLFRLAEISITALPEDVCPVCRARPCSAILRVFFLLDASNLLYGFFIARITLDLSKEQLQLSFTLD